MYTVSALNYIIIFDMLKTMPWLRMFREKLILVWVYLQYNKYKYIFIYYKVAIDDTI